MKKLKILLLGFIFIGCSDDIKYDGRILIDVETKKEYLLVYAVGKCYYIHEKKMKIAGTDTIYYFAR